MSNLVPRKTKIVATLGPASTSPEVLERLLRAGLDVARLNLAYGSPEEHTACIKSIRKLSAKLGHPVAVLADLSGLKYRLGKLATPQIEIKDQEQVTLTTRSVEGRDGVLPVNLPSLPADVHPGSMLLIDEGAVKVEVREIAGTEVYGTVVQGGTVTSGKGVYIPGRRIAGDYLTPSSREQLDFCVEQGVDFVGLSFVTLPEHVAQVRRSLREKRASTRIIAKIERPEGLENASAILGEADGIMVARGDLGLEIPLEKVPLAQKHLIQQCNRAGKPVITATQMLESMVLSPTPTRAEVTDVANAIWDGTDAIMLSEETSMGRYPTEAVAVMDRIARETDAFPHHGYAARWEADLAPSVDDAIAYAACQIAVQVKAAAIVAFTSSGSTALRISKYRPPSPILALTPYETVQRRLTLSWGLVPVLAQPIHDLEAILSHASGSARDAHLAQPGDHVVVALGLPLNVSGTTNLVKVHRVPS